MGKLASIFNFFCLLHNVNGLCTCEVVNVSCCHDVDGVTDEMAVLHLNSLQLW